MSRSTTGLQPEQRVWLTRDLKELKIWGIPEDYAGAKGKVICIHSEGSLAGTLYEVRFDPVKEWSSLLFWVPGMLLGTEPPNAEVE